MNEILLKKNIRNVVTIINHKGDIEELSNTGNDININDVIQGVADLNKNGILVLHIETGHSNHDGNTKLKNINDFGIFKDDKIVKEPVIYTDLPEGEVIPFKSDSWVLGEFIVKHKTGKNIPKRFLKTQNLLNTFIGDDEILKKLLVLNPEKRSYTWEILNNEEQSQQNGCTIH
jgi:hypothetical protein